jgi:type III pantothenate kinase
MLLAIDIGNTSIALGVFDGNRLSGHIRVPTPPLFTADECRSLLVGSLDKQKIKSHDITEVVIGSVVPELTGIFDKAGESRFGYRPLIVSPVVKLPIIIAYDHPEQLGADRIANAVAGFSIFGGPVIVVDLGTATKFEVVDESGVYLGGVITAGPETAMAALADRAARLFEVPLEPPATVIGKSTEAALKSGLFYGTVGQVDYIIDRILNETGFQECRTVATGGFAVKIAKHSRHISQIEPTLTLVGLRLIGEINRR